MQKLLQSQLVSAAADFGQLQVFLENLSVKTGSDAALFRLMDMTDFSYPLTLTYGDRFTGDFFQEYDNGMVVSDPQVRVGLDHKLPPLEVYLCSDHYSEKDRSEDPYFRDFLPKYDIKWFAGYLTQFDGVYAAGFGVARGSDKPSYSDEEKNLLAQLAGVFEDWAQVLLDNQRTKLINRALKETLRRKPDFAACVDAQGRLLWMDEAAEKVVAGLKRLVLRNGVLTPDGGRYAEQFMAAAKGLAKKSYASVTGDGLAEEVVMNATLESGRRIELRVVPIHAEEGAWANAGLKGALILGQEKIVIADPAAPGAGDLSVLSNKELEVARLVSEGLTAPQAAERLGIAPSTIQTHLKRSYKKLGLKSKHALAALYIEKEMEKRR